MPSEGLVPPEPYSPPLVEALVQVQTSDGLPLGGLRVNGDGRHGADVTPAPGAAVRTKVPASACARFTVSLAGDYALDVTYLRSMRRVEGKPVILVLPERHVSRGRLLDADGVPLAGVHVMLTTSGALNETDVVRQVRKLRVFVAPGVWEEREDEVLVRRMDSTGKRALDALSRRGRRDSITPLFARTDDHGCFAFAGLKPEATYRVTWPGAYGLWARPGHPVRAGDSPFTVVARRHGFRVRAVDSATGRPVTGLRCFLSPPGGWEGPLENPEGLAPRERPLVPGNLAFGDPGARCALRVSAPGYTTVRQSVVVAKTPGLTDIVVTLQAIDAPRLR